MNLIVYPLRGRAARRWRFVPLLILSQLATGVGAVKAALTDRPRRAPESSTALEGAGRPGA